MVDLAATGKLSKTERDEYRSLMESFGWNVAQKSGGMFVVTDKIGAERLRIADKVAQERQTLALLQALTIAPQSPDAETGTGTGTEVPSIVGLDSQLAEITQNAGLSDTALAAMIKDYGAFLYKTNGVTYLPADYMAVKIAARSNPAHNDATAFTDAEKHSRMCFNLKSRWDKTARAAWRAKHGIDAPTPTPRLTTAGTVKTVKNAGWRSPFGMAFSVLGTFDQSMTLGDALATLAERFAASVTVPTYYPGEHDVTQRAAIAAKSADAVRAIAQTIPARVIDDAIEAATDAERTIYILTVGKRYETSILKESRMRERFAGVADAFLVAIVAPDGSVNRLSTPERLTAIPASIVAPTTVTAPTIPQSLIDATTAKIDPASTVNVVTTETASGMTASDATRLEVAAD